MMDEEQPEDEEKKDDLVAIAALDGEKNASGCDCKEDDACREDGTSIEQKDVCADGGRGEEKPDHVGGLRGDAKIPCEQPDGRIVVQPMPGIERPYAVRILTVEHAVDGVRDSSGVGKDRGVRGDAQHSPGCRKAAMQIDPNA